MAERRIIVKESRIVASGNRNGRDWTIYELNATRDDHTPLPRDMKLRSFEDLPLNEVLTVDIEKFHSEQYGDSYTVKRKGKGGHKDELAALRKRVEGLEEKVDQLASRLYAGGQNGGATPNDSPSVSPTPAGVVPTDDDIPF